MPSRANARVPVRSRPVQRTPRAILSYPPSRSRLIARFRKVAITSRPCPVRTSVRGWPPERSVVCRWMTSTCLAWGNHVPAGTGAVWTLRCSMRPWPRSTVWCTGGKRRLGQVADGGLQGGLVALDGEQVVGLAVTDQVAGMLGLGVERIGSDDPALQIHPLQQRPEPGDLVALGVDPALGQHHP